MTVASIEQSRATSARSGTDANAAGDPAGLFALLMATLGMPFQMGGNANGLASLAGPQATAGDAPAVAGPDGDALLPNAPAANLPGLNATPILAGQQPVHAEVDSERPAQTDFTNLLASSGPAVPANSAAMASEPEISGTDTNDPTTAASTISTLEAPPAAPAFVPATLNDAHASALTAAHPITNNPSDAVEKERSESRLSRIVAANDADRVDRAPAPTTAAPLASSAEPPRSPALSQIEVAKTAPALLVPSRNQTIATDHTGASGSERPTGTRDASAASVELPSIAVAGIGTTTSSESNSEHSTTFGKNMEIIAAAPALPIAVDDTFDIAETSDQADLAGPRSIDLPATSRPVAGFEATPLRPETPAPIAERTPLQHVGAHITRAIVAGTDRLILQLVPAELGRIDIALDVRDDGQVRATVRADNPTTLDLLQRDSRNLERALESAGLRAESGSLSFSLRSDGRQNQAFSPFQNGEANDGAAAEDGIAALPVSPARSAARGLVDLTI